jgi:hypothetical protein
LINICVESQSLFVNVALRLPLLYGGLVVHELGHLIAGKIMGIEVGHACRNG